MTRNHSSRGDDRGVSAVVAFVLLVGLVAVGSIGILVLAGGITQDSQQNAEQERVKTAFVELQGDVNSIAQSEDGVRTVEFDYPEGASTPVRKDDAGTVVVRRENLTTTQTVVVKDIGALVYDDGDVHYAYQAGAVWRGTGNDTQRVAAPNLVYDTSKSGGDPTFTLPIVELEGDRRVGSGTVTVSKNATEAPLDDVSRIDNQLVTIEITSDYYVGWGQYFEDRYDEVVVEYDHPANTAIVKLGRVEIGGDYDTGIVADGDVEVDVSGSDYVDSEVEAGGNYQSGGAPTTCDAGSGSDCYEDGATIGLGVLDNAIAQKAEDARSRCGSEVVCVPSMDAVAGPGYEFEDGNTYYVQGDTMLDGTDVQADLSDGNVTIVVDGDVGMKQGGIVAENPNVNATCCYLRIYFNGTDVSMGNKGGIRSTTDNATRVQVYGTSNFHLDAEQIQSGHGFDAALYASGEADTDTNHANNLDSALGVNGCDKDVCFGQGSGTVEGAVIAGSVEFQQSVSFEYDDDLQNVEPTLGQAGIIPPPITYLHVSVNKVCVGNASCGSSPSIAGPRAR